MPNFDGTGPQGHGPLTGRGFGPCGRGWGRGSQGFGRGRNFGRSLTKEEELADLNDQEKYLQEELDAVKDRKQALQG